MKPEPESHQGPPRAGLFVPGGLLEMPFRLFTETLRDELRAMPLTFLSVCMAWVCIVGMIVALWGVVGQVGALSNDFTISRIEQTEEQLQRNRERFCDSTSREARSLYSDREARMQRRYRSMTGAYLESLPDCSDVR